MNVTSGPEVLFKTCVAMKFVDDDDDDDEATGLRTVFAVGVGVVKRTAASIEIFVGEASAAVLTHLTSARMIAVTHIDTGQLFLQ